MVERTIWTRRFKDYFERTRPRERGINPSKYRLKIPLYDPPPRTGYSDGEWSANQARRFVKLCMQLDVQPAEEEISRIRTITDSDDVRR